MLAVVTGNTFSCFFRNRSVRTCVFVWVQDRPINEPTARSFIFFYSTSTNHKQTHIPSRYGFSRIEKVCMSLLWLSSYATWRPKVPRQLINLIIKASKVSDWLTSKCKAYTVGLRDLNFWRKCPFHGVRVTEGISENAGDSDSRMVFSFTICNQTIRYSKGT